MSIQESNSFEEKLYPIPKTVEVYDDGTCIIQCKKGYAYNKGWALEKPIPENSNNPKIEDFKDAIANLKFDMGNSLFKAVLNFYQDVAENLTRSLRDKLMKTDEVMFDRLQLGYCLDFLRNFYDFHNNVKDVEGFFRNAFTCYILKLANFEKYYNKGFDAKKFVLPFELLIDRVDINTEVMGHLGCYEPLKEVPTDLNHIRLCYDLMNSEVVLQTFDPRQGFPWRDSYPLELADNYYYLVGLIPIENMWKMFSNGNHYLLDCVDSILARISYLKGNDNNSEDYTLLFANPELELELELELDDDARECINSKDIKLLMDLKTTHQKIEDDYRNGNKEDLVNYTKYVKLIKKIVMNSSSVREELNNKDSEINNLVTPILNGVREMKQNYVKIEEDGVLKCEIPFTAGSKVYGVFEGHIDCCIIDSIRIYSDAIQFYDNCGCFIGDTDSTFKCREDAEDYWLREYSNTINEKTHASSIMEIDNEMTVFHFAGCLDIPVILDKNVKNPELEILKQTVAHVKNRLRNKYREF